MTRPYTDTTGRKVIEANHLLLVEGKDEINLFTGLIKCRFPNNENATIVQIEQVGKSEFRRNFGSIVLSAQKSASLKAIGIVRDADGDASAAFDSVCDGVRNFGYEPPQRHGHFSDQTPGIGVFITPDGEAQGAIETICRRSVMDSDAGRCVEAYLNCLKEYDSLLSSSCDKSFAHAYLSALRDPVARVGEGALQGAWNFGSQEFAGLYQFIRDLTL